MGIYDRLTAYENVQYYADIAGIDRTTSDATIKSLFTFFGITDYQHRQAGKLSTGMRQKIALVRAVVHQPSILIFDEPTLGLDVIASQAVLEFIEHNRRSEQTMILSTHSMHLAQEVCDRVGVIHKGTMVTVATPKHLINQTGANNLEQAFLRLIHGGRYA